MRCSQDNRCVGTRLRSAPKRGSMTISCKGRNKAHKRGLLLAVHSLKNTLLVVPIVSPLIVRKQFLKRPHFTSYEHVLRSDQIVGPSNEHPLAVLDGSKEDGIRDRRLMRVRVRYISSNLHMSIEASHTK